jgi:hypothetical protein
VDLITAEKKDLCKVLVRFIGSTVCPEFLQTKKVAVPKISIVQMIKNDPTVLKYKKGVRLSLLLKLEARNSYTPQMGKVKALRGP